MQVQKLNGTYQNNPFSLLRLNCTVMSNIRIYWVVCTLAVVNAQSWSELGWCITNGPEGCLSNKLDVALSRANRIPELRLTRDLSIVALPQYQENEGRADSVLSRLENYLYGHSLKLKLPQELAESTPRELTEKLPEDITVPLAVQDENQGRGFMKKVVMPFLLGLKFKATAVIPIALALIALKTWKALTLGLLSIVLSGAMVIFKLIKPKVSKVQHYEVFYPPPHHHHIIDDHHHHFGRSAQDLAYSAHFQ